MVITSLGINKSQKKFQPKVKAKVDRRPVESQEPINETSGAPSTQLEVSKESIAVATEKSEQGVLPQAIENDTGENVPSTEQTAKHTDAERPIQQESSLAPPKSPIIGSVISPPIRDASKDAGVFQKTRGKAIAAPTFKAKTREVKPVYFDSTEDGDKPFNILEHLNTRIKKASEKPLKQKREREVNGETVPKKGRGRPKKVVAPAKLDDPSVTAADGPPSTQLDQDLFSHADVDSTGQEMSNQKRSREVPTVMASTKPESLETILREETEIPNVPAKRAKNTKRKNKVLPNKHIVQAINEYTGSRPLDLSILPLDTLCHSNITYGKPLDTPTSRPNRQVAAKKQSSPPPSTSTAKSANVLAVQVKMVNGEFVFDNSEQLTRHSLTNAPDYSDFDVVEEGAAGRYINCMTYVKRLSNARWSSEETEKFYEMLAKWGSDFERLAKEFPERERRHLVKKFKREEKVNPSRINEALLRRVHTPITPLP